MKSLIGGGLLAVFALPAGMAAAVLAAAGSAGGGGPSAGALADIPPPLLDAYQAAAATCPGLPWSVLAAIAKVETDHGRHGGASLAPNGDVAPRIVGVALDGTGGTVRVADTDGGRLDGDPVLDRAVGPMQFLPGTWSRWGADGNQDGVANPHNAYDAIASAANYLCGEDGRIDDVAAAIATYNRSAAYVEDVLTTAAGYRSAGSVTGTGDVNAVLGHPGLTITANARTDLESGLVDPRVVAMLFLIADRVPVGVGVIQTGHSQCVGGGSRADRPGCSVSEHWSYRAVDLVAVGGEPVSPTNVVARELVELLAGLVQPLRPDEIGQPWADLAALPGVFSDASHQGHLHLGCRESTR
ncbi:MAG: lytic transglycosylase domain-containing protein [Acidimicrobiales bacterium]